MTITQFVELYNGEGEKLGESFFGSLQPARAWASEQGATFLKVFDVEENTEKYYLKSGAQGRWSETTEKMFSFVINRNKESSEG